MVRPTILPAVPSSPAGPTVPLVICVASPQAEARVARASDVAGLTCERWTFDQLWDSRRRRLGAIVYDTHPTAPAAHAVLLALREANPDLRILLYPPVRSEALSFVASWGGSANVWTKVQTSSVATFGMLCDILRAVTGGRSPAICEALLDKAVGSLPGPVRGVVRAAEARLAGGMAGSSLTVKELAHDVRASARSLVRWFAGAGLPPPKECLDWMCLLVVAEQARHSGCTPFVLARELGLDANAFYRMKKRRLGADGPTQYTPPFIRERFLRRCRAVAAD